MTKTTHSNSNNSLLEENVSYSITIVGQSEELDKATLIKANLNLKHIFFRLCYDISQKFKSISNRNRRICLSTGNFDIS